MAVRPGVFYFREALMSDLTLWEVEFNRLVHLSMPVDQHIKYLKSLANTGKRIEVLESLSREGP